ncbi:MAG: GerMN domain-containing protein [Clostridiales bacterium]|nr:GerMN domain-containing protein [Clostridiales bacterium]
MKRLFIVLTTVIVIAILAILYRIYPIDDIYGQEIPPDIEDNRLDVKAKRPDKSKSNKESDSDEDNQSLSDEDTMVSSDVNLYFLDEDESEFIIEQRRLVYASDELEALHVINNLIHGPKSTALKGVINKATRVIGLEKNEDLIVLDLSSEFLESEDLLLARVSIVNSLTDLENIKYVRIYVDGTELTSDGTKDGVTLGLLSKYPNNLEEIISIDSKHMQKPDLREIAYELYFVDCQGMYLLPEVRDITVISNQYARTIVEELIKGPSSPNRGLYPIFPKGVQLLDIKLVSGDSDENDDGLELYFSKEFKQMGEGSSNELTTLGSLVYSLTRLPNVGWIKIYYANDKGEYIDSPIGNMSLSERLIKEDFNDLLGRRIKIYFSDKNIKRLKPQYRAINKKELGVARKILDELAFGPVGDVDFIEVIPEKVPVDRIKVTMNGTMAVVDLPLEFYEIQSKSDKGIISLYAIANSLTDPINTENIEKVLFLMDGKQVDRYDDMVIADPFVRNPALIED